VSASFARYDSRGYRTLDVAAGYAAWAPSYDATMDDRLRLASHVGHPVSLAMVWAGPPPVNGGKTG